MRMQKKRIVSFFLALVMSFGVLCFNGFAELGGVEVSAAESLMAEGGLETLYAEWADSNAKGATVEYKKSSASSYSKADNELIRSYGSTARVDVVGLSAGSYDIKVTASNGNVLTKENITVKSYDRSGYAHFNYTEGVGAYKDDGTPKDNAIVIYVTEENKNTVTVPGFEDCGTGIGWILNNNRTGMSKITANNSLIVRIIGKVINPEGTTAYDSTENGGTVGDNGHMARIRGGKNITIEGIGYDAMIYDWGVHFIAADDGSGDGKNFEVRNITFDDYPEDAVGMEGIQVGSTVTAPVRHCWVHNNSFLSGYCANPAESDKGEGDGSCDFKRGEYFTLSYNYFEDCHKTNLVGASDSNMQFNLTFHHNWWNNCASRGPLLRQANIHIYNNYYQGNTSKTIDTRANSYAFVEANYLEGCKNPITTTSGSAVKSYKNIFKSCMDTNAGTEVSSRDEEISNNCQKKDFDTSTSLFYYDSVNKASKVEHLTNAATAKAECIAYSGVMKKAPVEPGDTSIIINNPTKAVELPYSLDFTSGEAGEKMAAAGIKEFTPGNAVTMENVIFNLGKKYSNTSTSAATIKEQGLTFKLDQQCVVTIDGAGKGYYPVLVNADGETMISGSGSATVDAGIYAIESNNVLKEATLNSVKIQPVGAVVTTTEASTETSTEASTEATSQQTTEKQTEATSKATENSTENTTEDNNDDNDDKGDDDTPSGIVAMGSYSLNSSTLTGSNCTYKNIAINARSVESTGIKLRLDNTVKFKVDRKCTLTMTPSSKGVIIIDDKGISTEKSTGKFTIELDAGSYTITGSSSKSNSLVSGMVLEQIGSSGSEDSTEKPSESTSEKTDESSTEKPSESTSEKADESSTEKPSESTSESISQDSTEKITESTTSNTEGSKDTVDMKTYSLTADFLKLSSLEDSYESIEFDIRGITDDGVKIRQGDTIKFKTADACYLTVGFYSYDITITDEDGNVQTLAADGNNLKEEKVKLAAGSYTISGAKSSKNSIVTMLSFAADENAKPDEDSSESTSESTSENTSEKPDDSSDEKPSEDTTESVTLYGDVDKDNKIDKADIAELMKYVFNMTAGKDIIEIADVDGDGKLTATDAVHIFRKINDDSYIFPVSIK